MTDEVVQNQSNEQNLSKDERIGYHKGSLGTLIGERNELLRMITVVEQLIQAHAKELEKLGVKLNYQEPQQSNNPAQ